MADILLVLAAAVSAAVAAGDYKYPITLFRLIAKGVAIWQSGGIERIEGERGKARTHNGYTVSRWACTCAWCGGEQQAMNHNHAYRVPVCKHMIAYWLMVDALKLSQVIEVLGWLKPSFQWPLMLYYYYAERKRVWLEVNAAKKKAMPAKPQRKFAWAVQVFARRSVVLVWDEKANLTVSNPVFAMPEGNPTNRELYDLACARFGRENIGGIKRKRVYAETVEKLSPLVV